MIAELSLLFPSLSFLEKEFNKHFIENPLYAGHRMDEKHPGFHRTQGPGHADQDRRLRCHPVSFLSFSRPQFRKEKGGDNLIPFCSLPYLFFLF